MENKYLEKIEFNKIIEKLESYAITQQGKKLCKNLKPFSSVKDVKHSIDETTECIILKTRKGMPPIEEIYDINEYIKNLQSEKSVSSKSLLQLANILKISRELKIYITENIETDFAPITSRYFKNLYSNPKIENTIFSCIIDENTIDDKASTELFNIRKSRRNLEQDIRKNLSFLLNSKYIQEPIVTIRNNRFVIPVKAEYKNEIKGFTHDISASGSTIFIEPFSVFEMNNKINSLKTQENIEIEKILFNLSRLFFNITNEIENNVRLISMIDFAFAKAKYAISINATEPIISKEKIINLKKARHPLIDKEKVVPIDISIGENYSTLVITGPNTGGKTVSLKTVALLTAMAMSGLYIPAAENSLIHVFDNIFADIGDEQSISQSLSTFSSHITNIIEIINKATPNSLIILDELGAGTDPIEGANLGISILDYLHSYGCIVLATTHYPEVKNYALITEGFENASSEFDLNTLSPTYKLLLGVPGKSMAFEISKKLGLKNCILENAKSKINSNSLNIEELIKNIYNEKATIEKEKEKIVSSSIEIEKIKNELELKQNELNEKKEAIIENAKLEAKNILISAKQDADEYIRNINSTTNTSKIRNEFKAKISQIDEPKNNTSGINPSQIEIGLNVYVNSLKQNGVIISVPDKQNKVLVEIGNTKTKINVNNLSPATNVKNEKIIDKKITTNLKSKTASTEINVIGLNVDEACFIIDKFLDDASLSYIKNVRIIHGKGTGALKNGIHTFLKKHPHVKSFRIGTFGEGEMGVTIVEIK